ncbi:MAG: SPOR domain-containing protein, partial [Oceanidesulfovibrio sp.]
LASRGHDPYILTMADDDGALWHTVRLDIHDSLVDALRSAREFYGDEGVPPSIVQLGSLRGLPLEEARFVVQVAAFESEENALRHAASLRSQGLDAGTMLREDSEGQVWRIVHIGVFDTFVDAADRARRYTEETDCECFVVVVAEDLLNESVLPLPEPDAAPPLEEAAPSPVFDAAHNASAESPNAKSATAPNE